MNLKKLIKKIKGTISEAAEFAIESEEPDLSDLFKDIYLQH
jgi:TPP-dependent pyruvate/acetoin dehydrogenase alpha subunit